MLLQWTYVCLSLEPNKIKVVADGQLLGEEEYKREENTERPANLTILFGFFVDPYGVAQEDPTRLT